MDSVSVVFVLSEGLDEESEASDIMIQAFEACRQNKVNTYWVKEKEICQTDLKKTDFIVFENFEAKDFGVIREKKSASIVGPWCVLICLMEGKKIPNFQWPIYNVAMYNCIVTSSNFSKSNKLAISEKVQTMGGCYSDALTEETTHLITDSVKTSKYLSAIEMGIKVMTVSWVDNVWSRSQERNIHCDDEVFKKFRCKPLHKLSISSTGILSIQEREEIAKLIAENGGVYSGKLSLSSTDFLICQGVQGAMSEKYRQARKTKTVHCVTLQWLHDSIKNGYCLPNDMYTVKTGTSTPNKADEANPNFSTISAIDNTKCDTSSIDESLMPRTAVTSKRKVTSECNELVDRIDIKKAKRCGQFLDGCSIYLVGFGSEQRDKMCKVINFSGATRYDDMSDRVTHVIVGDANCHEVKLIRSKGYACAVVGLNWLLDSIEMKKPCSEEPYLVNSEEGESYFKSPLGKKGLSLLKSNRTITENDFSLSQRENTIQEEKVDVEAEKDIIKQYLMADNTEEDTLANFLKNANYDSERIGSREPKDSDTASESRSTMTQEDDSQPLRVFQGLRFCFAGFDEEAVLKLTELIESGLGRITKNVIDANYIVTPVFNEEHLEFDKNVTVTDVWIHDSIQAEEPVPIMYYHRPLTIMSKSALEGCVIGISGYSNFERTFLASLIEQLGGIVQEQFARVTSVQKNVIASTHLVLPEATGKKYSAAIKWNIPAVEKDWLLQCAAKAKKLPVEEFRIWDEAVQVEQSGTKIIIDKTANKENVSRDSSNPTDTSKDAAGTNSTRISQNFASLTPKNSTRSELRNISSHKGTPAGRSFSNADEAPEPTGPVMGSSKSSDEDQDTSFTIPPIPSGHAKAPYNIPPEPTARTSKSSDEDEDASFTVPPVPSNHGKVSYNMLKTPENKMGEDLCSQVTPIDKIMKEVRRTNLLGTPESPQLARAPWEVDTPETPYGAYINPNPSRSLRKAALRFVNQFPEYVSPAPRRKSTPLSELKRRLWDKIGSSRYRAADGPSQDNIDQQEENPCEEIDNEDFNEVCDQAEEHETEKESETQTALAHTRLQQLEDLMATAPGSANKSRRMSRVALDVPEYDVVNMKESQPYTVQWDYGKDTQEEPSPKSKVFMVSGVNDMELRAKIVEHLQELGATVSELVSYDPESTHLVCPKPARNEKTLSCMAAGKWILHTNYIDACVKAGTFLNEEDYEFGNPSSIGKIAIQLDRDVERRMQAIHYWRNEVARTGRLPFQNMRALVIAEKKQALISVIEAGGGTVVDVEPPYNEVVHATHCLIELKSAPHMSVFEPLAKQGIYCLNTVYISDFLHRTNKDIKDSVLPFFQKYFK